MPHFTVPIGSDGPTVELTVAAGSAWRRRLTARGAAVPSPITVRALIDTGSDLSVVHPQVVRQLGAQATGSVRIRRPGAGGGFHLAVMFDIEFSIGGGGPNAQWISMRAVGVAPSTPAVLALIGRDLLVHCTLFYNGPRGELTLSR
jgi:hypothetical protein